MKALIKILVPIAISCFFIQANAQVTRRVYKPKQNSVPKVEVKQPDVMSSSEIATAYQFPQKYLQIGFLKNSMKTDGTQSLKTNLGISASWGQLYLVSNQIQKWNFGIDATWIDVDFTNYKLEYRTDAGTFYETYSQLEVGMQVGPSLVVLPSDLWNIHMYVRYQPCFSGLFMEEGNYGNFANFIVAGASCTWKGLGLGAEYRCGKCAYKYFGSDDDEGVPTSIDYSHSGFKVFAVYKF